MDSTDIISETLFPETSPQDSSAKQNSTKNIPEKLYFKIGEVADIIGVKPYVLRYWETEFPEIAPGKTKTKQRLYKRKGVELILQIRRLLYEEKFTIEGARRWLKENGRERLKEPKKEENKSQQIHLPLPETSGVQETLIDVKKRLQELAKLFE